MAFKFTAKAWLQWLFSAKAAVKEQSPPSRGSPLLRPLRPIDTAGHFASKATINVDWIRRLVESEIFQSVVAYFDQYPSGSLMNPAERAFLYCLIRALKPENVVEIGTYYAGTTEVLARAVLDNGFGCVHTVDPYGADRVSRIIAVWHEPLKAITTCSFDDSMLFLAKFLQHKTLIDFILIDGEHDFEFVRFDLEMSARLLRPNGIIVIDDADQAGPFAAAKYFLADHPEWRELGDCVASFKQSVPFDGQRGSVAGTHLLILQAPSYFVVEDNRFRSWGQQQIPADRITGFELELAQAVGGGILHVQTILRTFGGGQVWLEIKSVAIKPIELIDRPRTVRHQLTAPLIAVSKQGEPIDFCTAELVLFWQPERVTGSLKLQAPPRLLLPQATTLHELRPFSGPREWDGIDGLAVVPIDAAPVVADFQILQLVAVATDEVHSLSMRSFGHVAGRIYRAKVWVGGPLNANVRLIVRDSIDLQTGRPTNEIEIKVDLHSGVIIHSHGDLLRSGVEQRPDGWRVIWVDLRSADGNIFMALFLLEGGSNSHVFMPRVQRLLLGGFDIVLSR
jgi:predicted O-methyltransferase YrrM